MNESPRAPHHLDLFALEIIIVLALISLPDLLLSDYVSLPLVLRRSSLVQMRSLEHLVSNLEYLVPVVLFIAMLILWLIRRNVWERRVAIVYLSWVTLRLMSKILLIIFIITSRPQTGVGVLLKDTFVLWLINFALFGTWFWIIDAGGPSARRGGAFGPGGTSGPGGTFGRYDFAFPQRTVSLPGWEDWQPGYWDYLYLAFSSNTQFGLGDTQVLSLRAKLLSMLQITLSMAVIVFMASIAISLMR